MKIKLAKPGDILIYHHNDHNFTYLVLEEIDKREYTEHEACPRMLVGLVGPCAQASGGVCSGLIKVINNKGSVQNICHSSYMLTASKKRLTWDIMRRST